MIKTIVFSGIELFVDNCVFDRTHMSQFPGGEAFTDLAYAVQKAGFDFMTADIYQKQHIAEPALLLSDMGLGYARNHDKLIPAVCFCLESPIIANRFHHHIKSKAGKFHYTFAWGGTEERLKGSKTNFHPVAWPNKRRKVITGPAWKERRLLAMISGNKRAFQITIPKLTPFHSWKVIRSILSGMRTRWIHTIDPWMKSELYIDRLKAIEHFSHSDFFDLYGTGWDLAVPGFEQRMRHHIKACWRGQIPQGPNNKLDVLAKYKFSLCFENTSFQGYITEKIFDCFFAGTIPIYLGAPDITYYIPPDCFIDMRNFSDYSSLSDFLLGLSEAEARRYLDAASTFMASSAFDRFHSSYFVDSILNAMRETAIRHA